MGLRGTQAAFIRSLAFRLLDVRVDGAVRLAGTESHVCESQRPVLGLTWEPAISIDRTSGHATEWTAVEMRSATAADWETVIACEPSISMTIESARLAMARLPAGAIAPSAVAEANHGRKRYIRTATDALEGLFRYQDLVAASPPPPAGPGLDEFAAWFDGLNFSVRRDGLSEIRSMSNVVAELRARRAEGETPS